MKNNKRSYCLLPLIISTLIVFISGMLMYILFSITKYLPFRLVGLSLLLPISVNTVLLLFGTNIPVREKELGERSEDGTPKRSKKFWRSIVKCLKACGRGIATAFNNIRVAVRIVTVAAACLGISVVFTLVFRRMTSVYSVSFWQPVLLAALFVLFIILDKWCKHTVTENSFIGALLSNVRLCLALGRTLLLFTSAVTVIKLVSSYDLQKYLIYVIAFLYYYSAVFIIISFIARLIRNELSKKPEINMPLPFVTGGAKELGVLSYLENNTGITMRSLWSIRLIKHIVPYMVILVAAILWLSTGIIQIEPYQRGALYRFGKLQDDVLEPGIHLTLPTPFDKVVCYDTEAVNKVTIGYNTNAYSDNTWTGDHGGQEYKLLLGGGNELVSINLHLEYKISDLHSYLKNCSSPENLLEARAYELVTERTIETDLSTLLSVDRNEFAKVFKEELTDSINKYDIGLEVVSVVLESIHPPLDISEIYQQMISAEIEAEQYILNAEAKAAVALANAKKDYDTSVNAANAERFEKIANARASVAEFMASVEANNAYPDEYRFRKYLDALCKAYGKSRLVIVGEGIDSSNIYFTNIDPVN